MAFAALDDWTKRAEPGIKFYSGTATYTTTFDLPKTEIYLSLGTVKDPARVRLNGRDLGVI